MTALVCHNCGTPITYSEPISRQAECEKCRTDLRSCRNCRHWNERYNNQCTETEADPVADKARRNFCEYFYFSREAFDGAAGSAAEDRAAAARKKLEELFKPRPGAQSSAESDGE